MRVGYGICISVAFAWRAFAAGDASENFYRAIRSNNLSEVRALVKGGADVNVKDSRGTTPLMYAAAVGSTEAMKYLVGAGADVNAKNAFDATALMWSAADLDKVRLLIAKGAGVKAKSKQGRTALHMAAAHDGGAEVVKLLLKHGADVDARDGFQGTPLIEAADRQIVKLLLDKGADANAKNIGGLTPLMTAAAAGDVAWVKMLLAKGADVNAATGPSAGPPVKNGPIALGSLTSLMFAAPFGSPELVRALIDAGANVNARDVRGMTPLMLAIASDHNDPRVVKPLLSTGADPAIQSKAGEDAFVWARKFGSVEVLKALGAVQNAQADAAPAVVAAAYKVTDVRDAVQKSIGLLQRTTSKFMVEGGCASCHAHNVTAMAVAVARPKGINIDEAAAADQLKTTRLQWASFEQPALQRMDPPGGADMLAYALVGMGAERHEPDRTTDAMIFNLAALQHEDGSWDLKGVARPPVEDGPFSRTALSVRALQLYVPAGRKAEFDERIARAREWMTTTQPVTIGDRAMQLLGLSWAGADRAVVDRFAQQLISLQRVDGGWSQTRDLASDAYAIGQVLYALNSAGIPASDPAYQRGVAYLLAAQKADGSWHVASRAPKFQPYFQSGFPHDHDQWISSAATAWAAMALSAAIDETRLAAF